MSKHTQDTSSKLNTKKIDAKFWKKIEKEKEIYFKNKKKGA